MPVAPSTVARPLSQVNMGSGETVTSTLSSTEQTGDNTLELSDLSGNSNSDNTTANRVVATPRRLDEEAIGKWSAEEEEGTVSSKKSRCSCKEAHRLQANVIMQTKKESATMKLATTRIAKNNELPKGHKDKKSINTIVIEINSIYSSNISPKTAGTNDQCFSVEKRTDWSLS